MTRTPAFLFGITLILSTSVTYPSVASVADAITGLTGGRRARIVWSRDTSAAGTNVFGGSQELSILVGLDTASGGERVILSALGDYGKPLLTRDGSRIVFSYYIRNKVYVVNWDGSGLREICSGSAADVWADPQNGIEWVYVRPFGNSTLGPIKRCQIDNPGVSEVVWDKTDVGHRRQFWMQVSADGTRVAGAFPWQSCGVATVPNGTYTYYKIGCWAGIAPDNSYQMAVFQGSHKHWWMYDDGKTNFRSVVLNEAPGIRGWEVYHPKWSSDVRFLTMTGPYTGGSSGSCNEPRCGNLIGQGGPQVELYFGKFNSDFTAISDWVQVTSNNKADFYGDAWIDAGTQGDVRIAAFGAAPASIAGGDSTTLSWSTTNATAVSISPNVGAANAAGSVAVTPSQTTTYTLTADGPGGPVTRQATVTVSAPQKVSIDRFSADPAALAAGETATLSWQTTLATSVQIDTGIGTVSVDGSQAVSPTVTKTYTLTAEGPGGPVVQQVTVSVLAEPKITILSPAGGEAWAAGTTQPIRWKTENLDDVSIMVSTDGGQGWTSVADTVTATDAQWGDYPWIVPDTPSAQCVIRITGYFGEAPTVSNRFEITSGVPDTSPPTIAVSALLIEGKLDPDPTITAVNVGGSLVSVSASDFAGEAAVAGNATTVTLTAADAAGNATTRLLRVEAAISFAADRFTRARNREFLGLSREQEGQWTQPFFFIQMADTQFGFFNKDQTWEKETALVEQAVAHVNRLNPRFVVVCGDLVNQNPGGANYQPQVDEYKRIFQTIAPQISLVCVCGNHDVKNTPTQASIASYTERFGDDYFGFWMGGVRCLVLNSSLIWDPSGAPEAYSDQEAWFQRELQAAQKAQAAHILVFQHHPWFLNSPDEGDSYYNIPPTRRAPALSLMQAAGVSAVFAGHYHRNAYGTAGAMEMVTTSAVGRPLGGDPSGFRIVKVYRDRIEHEYYDLNAVPETVSLK